MKTAGRISGLVIQALRYLGKEHVTIKHVSIIRRKLAQADKLARDQREFVAKENSYEIWLKEKKAKEDEQIARDNEQNAREKALRIMSADLRRRENIIKQLEKQQGGNDG